MKIVPGISGVKRVGFIIAMAVSALCVAVYWQNPRFMETLENKSLDLRFLMRGAKDPGNKVVIVDVDDKSIAELGRWPWTRARMAELVERLSSDGAKVAVFDIIFSEKENGLTSAQADALAKSSVDGEARRFVMGSVSGDHSFKDAISDFGKVVLPVVLQVPKEGEKLQADDGPPDYAENSAFRVIKGKEDEFTYLDAVAMTSPVPELGEAASSSGHIYAYLDADGAMRWEALVVRYDDMYYPSLGLAAVKEYKGLPAEEMTLMMGEGVKLGDTFIPTDEHGCMLINYYGKERTFKYYPFADVLKGRVEPGAFKDKIVLIGTSALGIYDLRVTPFSGNMPGVEKHANVIENILNRDFLVRRESMKTVNVMVFLGLALVLGFALPRLGAVNGTALAAVLLGLSWTACYVALTRFGTWLNMVYPTLEVVAVALSVTSYRFLIEEKKARSIKKIFASYVTPKIVEQLSKNPELAKLSGERKEITVLFSDVRGFTTFSESRQPEEVVARLNEYMSAMTDIIFSFDGTVDKFVGDEIMAFWGAPLPQEDQAERAVLCAAKMVSRLREMQQQWAREGKAPLDMGIGINTGEVVVGNMGAEGRKMDYTIIGDSVNLGARVETLTRNYNAHILISEYTYKKLMGRVDAGKAALDGVGFKELDSVKVKGKAQPVVIYRVDSL